MDQAGTCTLKPRCGRMELDLSCWTPLRTRSPKNLSALTLTRPQNHHAYWILTSTLVTDLQTLYEMWTRRTKGHSKVRPCNKILHGNERVLNAAPPEQSMVTSATQFLIKSPSAKEVLFVAGVGLLVCSGLFCHHFLFSPYRPQFLIKPFSNFTT